METKQHTCPVWVGRLMVSPLRKLKQNPSRIFLNLVKPGMTILEIGPAMGFFSLPLAKITGEKGKVYCVDIQEPMLALLKKRAKKAKLNSRIETRLSTNSSYNIDDLNNQIDFSLLFAVVHEVLDQKMLFKAVYESMKLQGLILIAEPKGHIKNKQWQESLAIAENLGLQTISTPEIAGSHAALLVKN